ncbi:NosD domain-containing protein [Methanosarcina sp. DH2]|uniref:NosD domain-containing protein n=1 Tax=Methanosarcina sp. DH2 TaxID=2605639 RepID=UPI001E3F2EC4|nr:NosD domain-containing protein [Methanosarcina sp. DH2]
MLKKQLCLFSLAVICLLLGQAAAISENLTFIENISSTSENSRLTVVENNILMAIENNESNSYGNNGSIPSGNYSSELFSFAPLNPEFEEYLESEELNEGRILLTSGEASEEETENLATGFLPAPVDLSHLKTVENLEGEGNYPVSYNLRTLGRVSPIRDQMDAGSCWAFGAYASLESYILGAEGKNMDFSENNVKNLLSEEYPQGFDRTYDDGGNAFMTTAYLARWSGPVSETDDPYDSHSGISPTDLPSLKRIKEVLFLPARNGQEDNDLIKWALMNYGVVSSVIYYSPDAYDAANCTYYYTGSNNENHLIGFVGWDDSFDRNKFNPAAPGDGAFIVKNSWGTNWGEEGFFYISYYDTAIGSANNVHTTEDLNSYSHVYQYDPLGWIESIGVSGSSTAWAANVFTAEKAETLEAVSFYTPATGTEYEIYVYTDPLSGPVNSAGAETSANGTIALAGYHTISLGSAVQLETGQNFSVVVKFTTPEYSYPVAVEFPLEGYSSKASANPGESFFSPNGENWVDTALAMENTNVCIKAFTNRSETAEAAFTANVTSGPAPLIVGFIDASLLSPMAWNWDFGDGNTSTDRFPTHKYTEAGKYNVTLHVENEYGNNTLEKTEWVHVTNSSLLYVDDDEPADFTSIQDAVDASSPGATIIVRNGTYTENVDVDRAVTILSESGPEYTEVRAANSKDSVFYVTADSVNISGFSVSGGSKPLSSSAYSTAGIWLYEVKNCNISQNVLSDNYCGLYVILSENCTLEGNTAESNNYGIYLSSSEGNTLQNNRMENNSYNFAFPRASTANDIDESNTVDGKPIYFFVNESNLILDSGSNAGTVYCINCQNVTVRDLNLSGNLYGLYFYSSADSHVENIRSSDNRYAFYISGSSGLNFTGNHASSNSYGLYIVDSEWNSLSENILENNTYNFGIQGSCTSQSAPDVESSNLLDGKPLYILSGVSGYVLDSGSYAGSVCLLNCQNITVRDLVFHDERFGIYLYGTGGAVLENNTLSGNYYGACLTDSGNNTVHGNKFSGNSLGIYLEASSGNILANNTLSENSGYGVYLYEARNNTINGNNASGGYTGIRADCSNNNTFVENTAAGSDLGIDLFDSDYNVLTANNANSNNESGVLLTISQHNTLSENIVVENTRGITLEGWTGEISTSDNILFANTISNNSEFGIWLTAATNNTIYGNSFNNTKNVKDTGNNIWNTTAGNYWSDYAGSDADGNGIGDTPYIINSLTGSKDYLPVCREPGVPITLTVGPGSGAFSSIQAAVDAAWERDTLLVSPGTYTENVKVNKSISIISSSGNPDDTIVHAAAPEEHIFNVTADSVTISGFTVSGASEGYIAGIYMEGVSGCILSENVLFDSYFGAWLSESENCTLSGNTVTGGRFGIYLEDSGNNTAVNNSISSVSTCGLWLDEASGNELYENELLDNGYGIAVRGMSNGNELRNNTISGSEELGLWLAGSEANVLRNNSMQDNTFNFMGDYSGFGNLLPNDIDTSNLVDGRPIYYIVGESDLVLDSASNAGTVYLMGCENVTVRDLVLKKNGIGVFVSDSSNSTLYNLTVSENEFGIMGLVDGSSNCSNNTVENNVHGIYFVLGENNDLNNNRISENEFGLMLLADSCTLKNNLLSGNEYNFGAEAISGSSGNDIDTSNLVDGKPIYYLAGKSDKVLDASSNAGTVYLIDCENITVRGQVLEHNVYGLFLYNTTNSSFDNNVVSLNLRGIYLYNSGNNSIYNNLFRNSDNIRLSGKCAGNTWNTSRTEGPNILGDLHIGGNCWANPQGTGFSETTPDADGDGFCDAPYGIPGSENESDSFPLYNPPEVANGGGEEEEEYRGSSGSSGSRSALFGGVSGMSSVNVLAASVSRQQIIEGQQAEFTFSEPGCSVMGIRFVSGTSAGTVTGKVEILSGLPKTVLEGPEGMVFQYMNIVIGSQFFGESGNFEGAMIDFKVPRSWVDENNINEARLVLNRYHDKAWTQLETEKTGEDDEFLYFRAETPGFSFYSITGEKKGAVTITPTETSGSDTAAQQIMGNEVPDTTSEETKKSPGFGLVFAVAGILSVLFLLKKQ